MHNRYLDINYAQWADFSTPGFWSSSSKHSKSENNATTGSTQSQGPVEEATWVDLSEGTSSQQRQLVDFAVKVVFLVGQTTSNETQAQIGLESEQYGDVIQESFLDSYNNLTLKTIMMLKWVTVNCGDRGTCYIGVGVGMEYKNILAPTSQTN